ncbi:hypothetical protein GCM10023237_04130 [Streptomyces coeruleoprunus]
MATALCLTVTAPGTAQAARCTVRVFTMSSRVGTRNLTRISKGTDQVITLFSSQDCTGPSAPVSPGQARLALEGLGSFHAP